jgi:hypothetical protein
MNKLIINHALNKHTFTYEEKIGHYEIYFNDYLIKLPNFEKYFKNTLECINFISIPSNSKITIEKYYLRHYLKNPIVVDTSILTNILDFITINTCDNM